MRQSLVSAGVAALALFLVGTAASAAGPAATYDHVLKGTNGPDNLVGDNGRDKIIGYDAADKLAGLKGRDWLQGDRGDDTLRGGNGRDQLYGGKGDDKLIGGNGGDKLVGGPGKDRLLGGPGNDVLRAAHDGRRDYVDCGNGDDDRAFVDSIDVVTNCETVNVVS